METHGTDAHIKIPEMYPMRGTKVFDIYLSIYELLTKIIITNSVIYDAFYECILNLLRYIRMLMYGYMLLMHVL